MNGGAWLAMVQGVAESQTRVSNFTSHTSSFITGEGNGSPLQYSRLENPMDRGAWLANGPRDRRESDTTEVTNHACTRYPDQETEIDELV